MKHASHPEIIKRLKRAEGHLRSLIGMIEAGKPCLELAQQLHAVENAIGNAKRELIHDHIDHCLDDAVNTVRPASLPARLSPNSRHSASTCEVAMPNIETVIQSGAANAWLLLPTAVFLGALHALEPGHSKSMMTAFIVAIQGTAAQAALLAMLATVGHTIVVWVLALIAWYLGNAGRAGTSRAVAFADRRHAHRGAGVAHHHAPHTAGPWRP